MIALDTNILVYAHRRGSRFHKPAYDLVRHMAEGHAPYALFWPSLYEFLRVVTHHKVFDPPSTPEDAAEAMTAFLQSPMVQVLSETAVHQDILREVLKESRVTGNLVHDAHLVALAVEHGVHEILTLDQDFTRFPQVTSRNPF